MSILQDCIPDVGKIIFTVRMLIYHAQMCSTRTLSFADVCDKNVDFAFTNWIGICIYATLNQ